MARVLTVLFAALLLASAAASAQDDFSARLDRADALRSADPERSAALLATLEADVAGATTLQRQRIAYLRAYHLAVFGNRPEEAAERALVLFEQVGDINLKFRAGSLAASSFAITRDFQDSLQILEQVLPMRDRVTDKPVRHAGTYAAALLYSELGQYRLSLRYADEVIADGPDPRTRCLASLPQLEARYRLGVLPVDDGPLGRAIDQCLAVGERMPANFLRLILARKLADGGRPGDALELLRVHLPEMDAIGYQRLTVDAHALVATLLLEQRDLNGAEEHARRALDAARSFAGGLPLAEAHRVLYEVAQREGDAVAALAHYRRHIDADNASLGDLGERNLAYALVQDEQTGRDRQIDLLVQQNQLLRLRQEISDKAARRAWVVIAALILLVGVTGAWTWRTARRATSTTVD